MPSRSRISRSAGVSSESQPCPSRISRSQRPHNPRPAQARAIGSPAPRAASSRLVPSATYRVSVSSAPMRRRTKRMAHVMRGVYATAVLPRPPSIRYLPATMATAGILIIGNEILSGKVTDTNSPYLCRELRALGVDVERILTIPDDVRVIAREVRALAEAYDVVFTSGGIGPTHDDLTMDGVALAFGRKVMRSDSIAERIARAQNKPPNESQLKMAMVPEDALLIDAGDLWFPVVVVENVYVFPGIPELLRKKFESVRERFRGVPVLLKRVFVKRRESDIAAELNALLDEFPELMLGSYPKIGEESFHVLLTLESRDAGYLQRALDALLVRLPGDSIHKVE